MLFPTSIVAAYVKRNKLEALAEWVREEAFEHFVDEGFCEYIGLFAAMKLHQQSKWNRLTGQQLLTRSAARGFARGVICVFEGWFDEWCEYEEEQEQLKGQLLLSFMTDGARA